MALCRSLCPTTSTTILRGVPEPAVYTDALPSAQKDLVLHLDQANIDHPQSLPCNSLIPPASHSEPLGPNNQNCTATMSPATMFGLELKSTLSITSLKGTRSHGKLQWLHEDCVSPKDQSNNNLGTAKRSRPKMHLVIPSGMRGRRPSAKPVIGSSNPQMRPEPAEQKSSPDVSPPSGGDNISLRDSVVSPLSKSLPTALGRFQRSVEVRIPQAYPQTYRQVRTDSKTSTSSDERQASDASVTYSNRSSKTSAGTEGAPTDSMTIEHPITTSNIQCRIVSDVLDAPPVPSSQSEYANTNPAHYEPFTPLLRRYKHHPPTEHDREFRPTCRIPPARLYTDLTKRNQPSKRGSCRSSLAPKSNIGLVNKTLSGPANQLPSGPPVDPSPTLSEAENNLQKQLDSFSEDSIPNKLSGDVARQPDSPMEDGFLRNIGGTQTTHLADRSLQSSDVSITHAYQDSTQQNKPNVGCNISSTPPLPRRSSKRLSRSNTKRLSSSHVSMEIGASQLGRNRLDGAQKRLTIAIPEYERKLDDSVPSLAQTTSTMINRVIAPDVAEGIILNILKNISHLTDLFAIATINSGFYRVFKRHELDLIKSTLWKMSPPAWEYRQVAFPGHELLHDEDLEMARPQEEYTPSTYLQFQARDASTVRAIKSLIQERCQSFLRPEILVALLSPDPIDSARVDDALWRIWTFCKLFGCGKGREEDIVAQMDWLRGGPLVHQPACTFSITITDYMNDTLASAPEYFAKGNEGGLTAEQLFDMMELWNCLGVLLQGLEGHTAQAREFGIYDNTDIRGGDIDGEDMMLDEWCYYLLTLGLSTVLDLAGPHLLPNTSAFVVASWNGWTDWKPPVPGSTRQNFLKEAASRVYEDRIAHVYAESSSREVQREISKARIQKYILELQQRKNSGELIPTIGMSQERPMSGWDTVINGLTRPHPTTIAGKDLVSHIPSLRSAASNSAPPQDLCSGIAELPAISTPPSNSPLRRMMAQPLLPTPPSSTVASIRDRSSISTSLAPINEYAAEGGYQEVQPLPSVSNHLGSCTNDTLILPQRHLRNGGDVPTFSQLPRNESSLTNFWQPYTRNNTRVPIFPQPHSHDDNNNTPMDIFSRPDVYSDINLSPYVQPYICANCNLAVHSQQHNCNRLFFSQPHTQSHSSTSLISGSSTQGSLGSAEQPAFQRYQVQRDIYHSERHVDTAGKAINRIVEMGFTADQAREALRITDLGDGLRVDRAVELLLQRAM